SVSKPRASALWLAFLLAAGVRAAEPTVVSQFDMANKLDEIVVTARKREETINDVPVSITALSGTALERAGVSNIEGLIGTVPGLAISQNQTFGPLPNQTFLVLRGVGATSSNEPAVGTFVDGVYEPSLGFNVNYLDVERVEVLRGPQGDLFGRNTEGGAVSIVTRLPDAEFRGRFEAGAAQFGTYDLGATVSGPIADNLFAGVALRYESSDGYLRNTTLGKDADNTQKISGRVTLRATPTADFEAILRLEAFGNRYGYLGFGVPDDGSRRYVVLDAEKVPSTDNSVGASLTLNYSMGQTKLTSITGYNHITTHYWYDFSSNGDAGNFQDQRTGQSLLSEELRLSGSVEKSVDWLAGLYYFYEGLDQHRNFATDQCTQCVFPPVFNPSNVVLEDTQFSRPGEAVFGQLTYHPADPVDLTVGGRYSYETARAHQAGIIFVPGVGSDDRYDGSHSTTFSNFSPTASASYHWTPDVMSYVTVSRGYKSGGYDKYPGSSAAVGIPFQSETSTNYEIGTKSLVFDRRLNLTGAVFYIDLRNQQLATTVISPVTGLPVGVTANAGASSSRGAELDAEWYPVTALRLSASASYVDTRFDRLNSAVGSLAVGDAFPYVPKVSASEQADFTQPLPGELSLVFTAANRFVGGHYNGNGSAPFDPILPVQSYSVLDVRVALRSTVWEVSAYVNNVLDRFNVTTVYQPAFEPFTRANVLPPRTVGVRASYKW
ncbi:MAG: TonB-dependent receptor, partial [Gammaproteobacteria bacterium]|nr:TonB-dependent receptor [Gammaproteobacteria bacterium]